MATLQVTKRFEFEAAHYLERPELSPEQNIEQYHACSCWKRTTTSGPLQHLVKLRTTDGTLYEQEPHGHSYVLEVTVEGPVDDNGFVIDFKKLKALVNELTINKCDHRLLNNVAMFAGRPTTCENMILAIRDALTIAGDNFLREFREVRLKRLRLWETTDSYAEWSA